MLALESINPHSATAPSTTLQNLYKPPRSSFLPGLSARHPPRQASLLKDIIGRARNDERPSAAVAPTRPSPIPTPVRPAGTNASIARSLKDIGIDQWTPKIFSIINNGPAGGFVRYAISSRNELYVDLTGNRSTVTELATDIFPKDGTRYIAYRFRCEMSNGSERMKTVWFVWTPEEASYIDTAPYLNNLAATLIGLRCPSSIPIIEVKRPQDVNPDSVMTQMLDQKSSASTSDCSSSSGSILSSASSTS